MQTQPTPLQIATIADQYPTRSVVSWDVKTGEYDDEATRGHAVIATLDSGWRVTVGRYGAILAEEPQHQQVESTPVRLPKPGDYLLVVPVGADENPQAWWTAELVGYTPDGQFRVRSTRPDATTVQTVNNVRSI